MCTLTMIYQTAWTNTFIGKLFFKTVDRRYYFVFSIRIGHSGAYGRKATAITLITNEDRRTLQDIEKYYDTHIEELPADIANLI